jgi:hypothetical protein
MSGPHLSAAGTKRKREGQRDWAGEVSWAGGPLARVREKIGRRPREVCGLRREREGGMGRLGRKEKGRGGKGKGFLFF